jgi:replication-associated recombination protein RarA
VIRISDSLATTTIDTVQKVGEGKVQAALARAEFKEATEEKVNKSIETLRKNKADLQKEFDELSSSIVEHTFVGPGRLIKAFPDMKHRDYLEVVQELKNKMRDGK